jgi:hypothetical protein
MQTQKPKPNTASAIAVNLLLHFTGWTAIGVLCAEMLLFTQQIDAGSLIPIQEPWLGITFGLSATLVGATRFDAHD